MKEHKEHHINYELIYLYLLILTLGSIAISQIFPLSVAVAFIFTFSTIKAILIGMYYMHLRFENVIILGLALIPVLIFVIILAGTMPDILKTPKF